MDQEFDRIALDFLVPAVDLPFQLAARQYRTRPRQQRRKQRELAGGKQRCLAVEGSFARCRIQMKLAIAEQRRRAAAFAAKDCAHARQQFSNLERLYQIVVRAEIEAIDAVVNAIPRGHNDDWEFAARRAKLAQHLAAIRQREPKIEQRYLVGLI